MTRRWPCIMVAMLLCLLTVATSAFVEGAWVLWSQPFESNLDHLRKSDLNRSWDPMDASATEAGCRRSMKETIEELRQMYVGRYGNAADFLSVGEDSYAATIPFMQTRLSARLLCLPDSVDPREPKGK
jgi:hypothetical protein